MFLLVLLLCEGIYSTHDVVPVGNENIHLFSERGRNDRINTGFLIDNIDDNKPGSWPWAVSIGYHDTTVYPSKWIHYCDGTIASNNSVITSQACLEDFMFDSGLGVDKLTVRAGDDHLVFNREKDVQEVSVLRQVKHPDFDADKWPFQIYSDISVVFVTSLFDFSKNSVKPAHLPTAETIKIYDEDKAVTVTGWGGKPSGGGRKLEDKVITTITDELCSRIYKGEQLENGLSDETMCALNVLDLSGTCSPGRGSGLFRLDHSINRFVMTGMLSSNEDQCGSTDKPNIFVRIASRSIVTFLYKTIFDVDIPTRNSSLQSSMQLSPQLDPYYETCGKNRMVNSVMGKKSRNEGKWPWLVPLFADHQIPGEFVFFCASTLVSESKLITAAHCFPSFNQNQLIKARAGDVFLDNVKDDKFVQEVVVSMSHITIHPKYKNTRNYDLAIINLQTKLKFSKNIQPICLLSTSEADLIQKVNETALSIAIAGWGRDNFGSGGKNQKEIVNSILSKDICDKTHEDEKNKTSLLLDLFTEDVMCAGDPAGGAGTCRGDSGGGAFHFDQNKLRFMIRGVVSGSRLGQCGTSYVPNIYARLSTSEIMAWVFKNINFAAPVNVNIDGSNAVLEAGQEVELTCAAEGIPPPQIIWRLTDDGNNTFNFDESQTHQNIGDIEITNSTLSFTVPDVSDTISVQCLAKNLVGKLGATTRLRTSLRTGPPSPPCSEGSNFTTPCMCGSDHSAQVCGPTHIMCAKSSSQCLSSPEIGSKLKYMEAQVEQSTQIIREKEQNIEELLETIHQKEATIQALEEKIVTNIELIETVKQKQTETIQENAELTNTIKQTKTTVKNQGKNILELVANNTALMKTIGEKETTIKNQTKNINKKEDTIKQLMEKFNKSAIDGNWGSWSTCSKTCGDGQMARTRTLLDKEMKICSIKQSCRTEVTSPNYPSNYPNSADTEQILTVPAGQQILIKFLDFEVENDASCNYDYLQICHQNKTDCGRKLCGSSLPAPITFPSSSATVVFHSDVSETRKGFRLSYQEIDAVWGKWSSWSSCSQTCGGGNQTRTRSCTSQGNCRGSTTESRTCSTDSCVRSKAAGNVIFITGGVGTDTSTEVVDPAGSCSRITSPLPDRRERHSINRLGGDLVLCGGSKTPTSCISTRSPGGPWVPHSQLNTDRFYHASVATGDAIHVFGGASSGARATAETLEDGASSWKKHQLPTTIGWGPCAVEIENTVYLTGGYRADTQTWKWNTDQQWTRLADMDPPGRRYHGCALITVRNRSLIVVAGGYGGSNSLRTSAIYDIQENTWRSTGELNQVRHAGVMVNVGHELYMLGGYDGSNRLETIEKFNVATNEWVNTNLRMKQGRYFFAAISVDRADFC